jgi:hypothetical protein
VKDVHGDLQEELDHHCIERPQLCPDLRSPSSPDASRI